MRKTSLLLAAMVAGGIAVNTAKASSIFSFAFSGATEVPPVSTAGTGNGTLLLGSDMTTLTLSLNFSGLSGPANMGHIHCCTPPGSNAPVAVPFPSFPAATSGTYNRTFDLSAPGTLTGITATAFVNGLLAGNAYVNLHTPQNQSGEIRGNLVASPEPSTLGLLGLALAGAYGVKRFRGKLS